MTVEITDEMIDTADNAFADIYDGENLRTTFRHILSEVAPMIAAKEREQCAKIAETGYWSSALGGSVGTDVAVAIRARGNK